MLVFEFYCDRTAGTGYLCLSYNFISTQLSGAGWHSEGQTAR